MSSPISASKEKFDQLATTLNLTILQNVQRFCLKLPDYYSINSIIMIGKSLWAFKTFFMLMQHIFLTFLEVLS